MPFPLNYIIKSKAKKNVCVTSAFTDILSNMGGFSQNVCCLFHLFYITVYFFSLKRYVFLIVVNVILKNSL